MKIRQHTGQFISNQMRNREVFGVLGEGIEVGRILSAWGCVLQVDAGKVQWNEIKNHGRFVNVGMQ